MKWSRSSLSAALILGFGTLLAYPNLEAVAQGACPTFRFGLVLTATQWQACFDAKLGTSGGSVSGSLAVSGQFTAADGLVQVTPFGLGIGSSPNAASDPIQIIRSRNGVAQVQLQNLDTGTNALARFNLYNGTALARLDLLGSGFTTSGVRRQNGAYLMGNGPGGLTLNTEAAQPVYIGVNNAEVARFDDSVTAGQTRFLLYDVDNGTVERVTVGAADSGGSGFKVLRIPN